ncbi:MAG: aldo/keto reductase, partial [Actinomycetota bacterium]
RLQTDHIDLIQLHSVGNLERLDLVTAAGGALEAVVRARDEGLASWIGITGHSHDAPATHLEALRRFPFDSVLSPLNWVLAQDPDYLDGYERLVEEVKRHDIALMIIKSAARRNWPRDDDDHRYATWYEPFDDQATIDAAVAWVLSHNEITGIATAGDVRIFPLIIEAERRAAEMSRDEAAEVLGRASSYSSPFIDIPI